MLGKQKLQVFVSSTYTDLLVERQAAVSAILKAGHIPAGMELFASGDQSQMDVIKRWIDDSDVYMLILGGRYGSTEAKTGLSYTELEYDYAVSIAKPLFALVISDEGLDTKIKSGGKAMTEIENSHKLTAFRSKVTNKMCSFFSDTKDIRGGIYESLLEIMQTRDLPGWVPGYLVQDTKPLHDQIALLKSQNETLISELDELRITTASMAESRLNNPEFEELESVLRQHTSVMLADLSSFGRDTTQNVFGLFKVNRNLLVKGWLISSNPSDRQKWMIDNLFPTLLVHRLITVEQTPGGMSRYVTTERGLDFLAWMDRVAAAKSTEPQAKRPRSKPKPKPKPKKL